MQKEINDNQEFIRLINENRLKLYKTAMAILKNDDDASDAIQETLLSAYKNISNLKNKEYFTTWLITILRNKCFDLIKKNKKMVYVDDTVIENTEKYYDTYKEERAQGNSRIGALGKAAMEFVLPELMGVGGYMMFEAARVLPGAIYNGAQSMSQQVRRMEQETRNQAPFRSNTFVDSQQIYTMRQAGMALAEQSKYALQQTLMGDEARFMHR